ncbi:5-carboxymethyl-2-hydroxymuconateDelta-isomerase [Sulfobacillus acidophilus TPY]|uniref:5-carboxymethyl-2-hydroxymuconateDelta-isomerase n=1 Tax=Sulfobacillus acidophilus (strain ATCC 700253 / DSM 10332 / NAL) TaxID=679936 RepID=G8TXN9_SULAD|nr:5-carboxymethyl-2-hydroxymuconateDelta-isomerase [Sulfobacillus acidophilus TPY]AEW04995.1 5-carboxymethyl-2-hydroxymuconateDelta-isomerase [Sulfobacillus acidophilus DSM 10332]
MKVALFDEWRVGIVDDRGIVDITDLIPGWEPVWPFSWMLHFIQSFPQRRGEWAAALAERPAIPLENVRLRPPVPVPSKIVAAPVNYLLHQQEMGGAQGVYAGSTIKTIEDYGLFLKPPSSIAGPGDEITLPFAGRRTDHEAEVGIIIGRTVRNVTEAEADEAIFGFTGLLDLSVRGQEDRPYRKGFDGFCPIGPWIVTRDEIPDMNRIGFRLWVNGELRQQGNTQNMIYSMRRLVALASYQTTLYPGDIIASGTPEGVGEVKPGDALHLEVDGIGALKVAVAPRPAEPPLTMGDWFDKFLQARGVAK